MRIVFKAGDTLIEFQRNWFTGTSTLTTAQETIQLQSALNIGTHVSFSLKQSWSSSITGFKVVIEKTRPVFMAGFRPHHFKVFVDDNLVAEQSGF